MDITASADLNRAKSQCAELARRHYENFPVASYLLPRALRPAVAAIYAFARSADDIADEPGFEDSTRLGLLQEYTAELDAIETGRPPNSTVFVALDRAISQHGLPLAPFRALLSAFRQDVLKTRYADFAELRDYCRRSADPIGHLMLRLFRRDEPALQALSDSICTGLQLINHWQDVSIDAARGRIYLPQDELRAFGVSESQIAAGCWDEGWRQLMQFQIERAQKWIDDGAPLARALRGRAALQIRATVAAARTVLSKLRARQNGNEQARLSPRDWATISFRTILYR